MLGHMLSLRYMQHTDANTRTNMEESRNNNAFSALCARSTLCLLNETHRIPKLMFVDWFAVNLSKIHCLLECKFNSGVKAFLFA
jgi:hypothetical protein